MENLSFSTTNGVTKKFLFENHKDYYDEIFSFVKEENISLSERIWLYQNKLSEKPKCLCCNLAKVKFIKFYKGYNKYCSKSCAAKHTHTNSLVKEKRTSAIRCLSDSVKQKMVTKANDTKSNFTKEKKDSINKKRIDTTMEKWGVDNISKHEVIKVKIKNNSSDSIKKSNSDRLVHDIEESGFRPIDIDDDLHLECSLCKSEFTIKRYLFYRRRLFNKEICLVCNPVHGKSNFESDVLKFVSTVYDGDIISGWKFHKKYEIDIFLPELNIGIECNGLYWHSEIYREKTYHINKLDFFKENGIDILNIWEDDWNYKQDLIKDRLLYKLKLVKNRIYARKCVIVTPTFKETKEFLIKNHIQGWCVSKHNIGLVYNNEIVAIATFGNLRRNLGQKSKDGEFELLRFCSKSGFSVVGGLSKLISFFSIKYLPNKIISYCDISFNQGDSYTKSGFIKKSTSVPNYYWYNKNLGLRENRWKYRKDKLVLEGHDSEKTEVEIMSSIGYYRIWDCGSYLYEKKF